MQKLKSLAKAWKNCRPWRIVDKGVKECASFEYLSVTIKPNGSFSIHIDVIPILNYASEIWGFEEWSKLQTLHLKACKYALGVRSSITTDTEYTELRRVSFQCQRRKYSKFFRMVIIRRFTMLC